MPGLNLKITPFDSYYRANHKLPLPEMKQYIFKKVKALWRSSVRAFIDEVLNNIEGDIDSGMSAASLLPLAADVRMKKLISGRIEVGNDRGREYNVFHEAPPIMFGRGPKNIGYGIDRGEEAYKLEFGTASTPRLIFKFDIVVLQFFLHEQGLAKGRSHNWQSLIHGQEAFKKHWEDNIRDILPLKVFDEYLKRGIIPSADEFEDF